jgi:hypothetical protein
MRIRIRDLFDPGSGMEKFGSRINIPDLKHGTVFLKNFGLCHVTEKLD